MFFEIRFGIHTGPIVEGIVGIKNFSDVGGDAVSTIARMESNGEIGKVNISEVTYNQIKNAPDFKFESSGKIKAKGKSAKQMFFEEKV